VVSNGKGTFGRILLLFCMGLGLIASKTISEALLFNPKAILGYDIDNTLLGAHGWSQVHILVHNTSGDKILDNTRRQVGRLENAAWERMQPKSQAGNEGAVPGNP
jgi:hypothetical protein